MNRNTVDEFEETVDDWEKVLEELPLSQRHDVINWLCESYVNKYGRKPDSYQLQRLANTLLVEVFSNPDTYKIQNEEYPVLSIPQQKRRKRREFVVKDNTLNFLDYKVHSNLSTSPTNDNYK